MKILVQIHRKLAEQLELHFREESNLEAEIENKYNFLLTLKRQTLTHQE